MGLSELDSKKYYCIIEKVHNLKTPTVSPAICEESPINEHIVKSIIQQQKHLTDAESAEIIHRYQSGESTYQLAEAYDCHRSTISKLLKRKDIEVTKEKLDLTDAIEMYEAGHTAKEIASKYRMNESAVSRRLRTAGVAMRSYADYCHL